MVLFIIFSPPNVLNVSQIPLNIDDNDWAQVLNNNKETNYNEKVVVDKKVPKKEVSRNSSKK